MKIVIYHDPDDYPEDASALATMVDELVNGLEGPGDVSVSVEQSP